MDSDLIQQVTSKNQFLYEDVSRKIIGLSFDVMNELGVGFLESVYHRALEIALCSSGFHIQSEVPFEVEVKATDRIIGEHKAHVINYLAVSGMLVGLIINFGQAIKYLQKSHPVYLVHPDKKLESRVPDRETRSPS